MAGMAMLDATEAGRPAMEYILELQGKVRALKADRRRFRLVSFAYGWLTGAAVLIAWWYLFR